MLCKCGCGRAIPEGYGPPQRPMKFLNGHLKRFLEEHKDDMIKCACDCGQLRLRYNSLGKELKYITGHYWQGKAKPESKLAKEHKRQAQLGRKRPEHSERMAGKGNPNWHDGISYEPYGQEFNKQLKLQILERDSYMCQVCSNRATIPHHINYNKKDNSPQNLIAVCRNCNGKANYNRGAWLVYFFLRKWVGQAE